VHGSNEGKKEYVVLSTVLYLAVEFWRGLTSIPAFAAA
jgi:hypothetical protein